VREARLETAKRLVKASSAFVGATQRSASLCRETRKRHARIRTLSHRRYLDQAEGE